MSKEKKSNLEELKKEYAKLQKKYNLPSFKELNEDFQVEKAADSETEILIREIRRLMVDKFSNYLRFIEAVLNPVNTPMFILSIVKIIGIEEKRKFVESFKKLTKLEVDLIEIDTEFDEKKEAEFIKESYKIWQEVKKDILEIVSVIKDNWENKSEKNNKDYFC